jgi:putative endopeptidase
MLSRQFVDAQFDFRTSSCRASPSSASAGSAASALPKGAMGEAIGRDYVELLLHARSQAADGRAGREPAHRDADPAAESELDDAGHQAGGARQARDLYGAHRPPDEWRDYSSLEVRPTTWSAMRCARVSSTGIATASGSAEREARRVGHEPADGERLLQPAAQRDRVPAAILQPPFFDPKADPAINYWRHRRRHRSRDHPRLRRSGAQVDGRGVLRDWWTAEDAAAFETQAAKLGAQYEAVEFPQLPGARINGRVAMGENIGDLGGLTIAYEAYRNSLNGKEAPVINGFTGDQRFFLGWAQVWRTMFRDDALRQQLATGPHSPGMIRAYAPLRNIDAWYKAFDIKPSDPLYIRPEDRVRIW